MGILLAVGIVHNRAMDMSVMPWAIASQTIPILAIAPMIIVVLNSIGVQGLLPKAIISAYLSFFPVVVGMVKGLRSPDLMKLDLLKTYNATRLETFWKLRLPASMPYLFASLKIGIAASLVGAIVGELPTGVVQGLGAASGGIILRTDHSDLVGLAERSCARSLALAIINLSAGHIEADGHGMTLVFLALLLWATAWFVNVKLADGAQAQRRSIRLLVPTIFGLTIILVWELTVRGLGVPLVILPPPSLVVQTASENLPMLWKDFVQTFLKGALRGYVIGCTSAILVAILVERYSFLQRGLLPVASFMAALPIIGTAPILVMWFGFDWHSKAAVVVVMVFFPMLINAVAGLRESSLIQQDLMRTYAANAWQTFFKLKLPVAALYL